MVDQTLPANKTDDEFNTIIKNGNSAFVKVLDALIIARVPFLGYAVPHYLLKLLLGWLDSFFVKGEEQIVDDMIAQGQANAELSNKAIAYKNLLIAEKSGDKDAITKAIQALADANSALTHLDGVPTVH